ncbi:response regulator [Desulfovibrio subterraneus]|uniref:histidine kinase n=1 Tax=Desulfovibrio subterraneus TaxID=2718620 RepID=A0A7J0BJU1_9BACT|nr:response regulator [Desulfovibrio subterraneus]WBF68062.1 response regulator [Desulfovibrio subterraneus]GFM33940.1 histidine kinase [Desulfovibrio subterraneus]
MQHVVLLVDDEDGIRTVLGLSLADMGYSVHTAASGEEALRIFDEVRPHIVLTDIKMPGLSGLDLLERIKKKSPETEVIMLTGHGDMNLAIQSIKKDATDFITKPINDDVLEIALNRAHERITMRARLREHTDNLEQMVEGQAARLVEQERQLAALQVAEGFADGMRALYNSIDGAEGMFNQLPCFVAVHNAKMEIIASNPLYKERLASGIGARSWDVYPYCKGTGDEACPVRKVLETGEGQRCQEFVRDKDGNDVPVIVNAAPILDNNGEIELVLEIAADITEVKRLQEELRLTRHRYQQLFEESPCYISVQNRELKIVASNRLFRDDFDDDVGGFCHEIYAHRSSPCVGCPVLKTFEDGQPHQFETVVTSKRGEQRNVLVWTAPIRDANGHITEVMEMSTDITQLRILQDRLSNLGLLLGSTAHGIKGLLTALDGGVYRLGSGIEKDNKERIKDSYQDIRHLVERLRKMVLDILYYAKKRALQWEVVMASRMAEEVAALVEPKAKENNVFFSLEVAPDTGTFEADAGALSAALVNILENAVDACATSRRPEPRFVHFSVKGIGSEVKFSIRDNGVGMDRETRDKLFTLFFSSKGSSGTGIGLFVANQVVQQHGGRIIVMSEAGRGSTFAVVMPRRLSEEAKQGTELAGIDLVPNG